MSLEKIDNVNKPSHYKIGTVMEKLFKNSIDLEILHGIEKR